MELKEYINGVGRIANEARAAGEVGDVGRIVCYVRSFIGSTAGPTSAAACLREGKFLRTTRDPYHGQDPYFAQEMAW